MNVTLGIADIVEHAPGADNLGRVMNPEPEGDTTYSTKDLPPDAPRVDLVAMFACDKCGQTFHTQALLNVHRRTAHRPRV